MVFNPELSLFRPLCCLGDFCSFIGEVEKVYKDEERGRLAAVTCLVIGVAHGFMYLYMLSGGGACHGQFIGNPFPFHDFPSSSPSHSPFNDHGEPVSSLLDRSLRLKARYLSGSPHYSPFALAVFVVVKNN